MASNHCIAVSVRVRPPRQADAETCVDVGPGGISVVGEREKTFSVANVVTGSDQAVAYDAIAGPLMAQLRAGYSCTLLAYGQTGSGKTHTVFGPPGSLTEASVQQAAGMVPPAWGLLPRIALELLNSESGTLHASAVEVYLDKAYDLLADRAPLTVGSKNAGLNVGGGPVSILGISSAQSHGGVHPPGCRCSKCWKAKNEAQAARMAKRDEIQAARGRGAARSSVDQGTSQASTSDNQFATVGETLQLLQTPADIAKLALLVEGTRTAVGHALNARSSRSHCLVHLHITQRSGGKLLKRQLLFVDLAGSERILKSGVEGAARLQATAINGSLTTLGKVIRALGTGSAHVPYRDSTLTMLLRASLGGKASTSVVIQIAPDSEHAEESACSLEFGQRMAAVRNNATVVVGQDAQGELESIRAQLVNARAQLAKLELDGMGESFGPGSAPNEIRSFQDNVRRFAAEEAAARIAKAELAELKASGKATAEALAAVSARVQNAMAEAENYKMILLRQKSIKGFYIPPKPGYLAKGAEVRELETKLAQMEVSAGGPIGGYATSSGQ